MLDIGRRLVKSWDTHIDHQHPHFCPLAFLLTVDSVDTTLAVDNALICNTIITAFCMYVLPWSIQLPCGWFEAWVSGPFVLRFATRFKSIRTCIPLRVSTVKYVVGGTWPHILQHAQNRENRHRNMARV